MCTKGSAHRHCVNNLYTKFEYKGIKTVGVTDYTKITQCKHTKGGIDVIMSRFKTLQNIYNYNKNCTK